MDTRPERPKTDEEQTSIATVAERFARIAGKAAEILLLLGLALEVVLRMAGVQPETVVPSATQPDPWTEWAMTPNVVQNEWTMTNDQGLHEDRAITLAKPPGKRRIAVLGSSVTWGLGHWLRDTIPRAAQERLRAAGCAADVINFAGIGYGFQNASAQLQTKVVQFDPDVVIVVLDLGLARANYADLRPGRHHHAVVHQLDFLEGAVKHAAAYSVVVGLLDEVSRPRVALAHWLPPAGDAPSTRATREITSRSYGLRSLERVWESLRGGLARLAARLKSREAALALPLAPLQAHEPAPIPWTIASYEARRRKEIASVVSADSAFAREMGFRLYFVTPYAPYFRASEAELTGFSLNMLERSKGLYGGLGPAARREMELISEAVEQAAHQEGARVINLLPASRAASATSSDFTSDGIHLSAEGNRHLGRIIAERLLVDGACGPRDRQPQAPGPFGR